MSELSYSQLVGRLETIIRQIEHDSPDVDELTRLVAEAVELNKQCRAKLTVADKRLSDLIAKLDESAEPLTE